MVIDRNSTSGPPDERMQALQRAAEQWKKQLVDVSGRNRLLNYRHLKVGTLDLTPDQNPEIDLQMLNALLAGRAVHTTKLFSGQLLTPGAAQDVRKRLTAIHRQARENLEEKGLDTLFMAVGVASWIVDSGSQPAAPVILVPISVTPDGAGRWEFSIKHTGEPYLNPVLVHLLRTQYGIDSADQEELALPSSFIETQQLLNELGNQWTRVPGLEVQSSVVISNFRYTNMPMVADLENNLDAFADNDFVAAIAGVEEARQALVATISDPPANRPDVDSPQSEFLILDADSSQHRAINRILSGESLVIWGPPGTGKSQTIANLITSLVADGKRVLFVAEKRAAIEVVVARLQRARLADLVMDAHGGIQSKREFAQNIADSIRQIGQIAVPDNAEIHRALETVRTPLVKHEQAMHHVRAPWNISVFNLQSRLLGIPESAHVNVRLQSHHAAKLNVDKLQELRSDIQAWLNLEGPSLAERYPEWMQSTSVSTLEEARATFEFVRVLAYEQFPAVEGFLSVTFGQAGVSVPDTVEASTELLEWFLQVQEFQHEYGDGIYQLNADTPHFAENYPEWLLTSISTFDETRKALESVRPIAKRLPLAQRLVDACLTEAGLPVPDSVNRWQEVLDWLTELRAFQQQYGRKVYQLNLEATQDALAPRSGLSALLAPLFSSTYRKARSSMRKSLVASHGLSDETLKMIAAQADHQMQEWKAFGATSKIPAIPSQLDEACSVVESLTEPLEAVQRFFPATNLFTSPIQELYAMYSFLTVANQADEQSQKWQTLGGTEAAPVVPTQLEDVRSEVARLAASLTKADRSFPSAGFQTASMREQKEVLSRLAGQQGVASNMPRIRELERRFNDAGIDRLLPLIGEQVPEDHGADAVEYAWLSTVWEEISFGDPFIGWFNVTSHNQCQTHFIDLDRKHLATTPGRIRRRVAEHAIEVMNKYQYETDLVRGEAAKRTRHMPIRRLFAAAPHVLTAIRPCWTMSPLLVAEMTPAEADLFDVVIFDEASQVPPAEAIGSLARAPQAVIAGDDRQLPPTTFFSARDDDEEDEEDIDPSTALISDIESILDVAKAGPLREELLKWHYRSRDGRLIAFSNSNIYGEALTAFPDTASEVPISHHLLPFRPVVQRSTVSHPDEVEAVVELVIEHARQHPDESLGVIAFGRRHADNIEEALRLRRRELADHTLDSFFDEGSNERFFVKNIETVQGDERDVIILSVGYHKASNGSLPYRFGPLLQEGGERRLNVAITRARLRVHVVSSFSHLDMEPGRSKARGVELLRQYLEFASSGGTELGATTSDVPLNAFELDVMHRLEERGVPVTPQYGVAGYRIDFACAHPNEPGRMVLAIEADGASYHSGQTARERDRLRQTALEERGWAFHRIWSTSWFKNRDEELDRAVEAWRQAVRKADAEESDTNGIAREDHNPEIRPTPTPPAPARSPRPSVPPGYPIDQYSRRELISLAQWVLSDTLLRTDEELMAEMRSELGFRRRGSRIDSALTAVVRAVRNSTRS